MEKVKMETVGYMVVYDLPNEDRVAFKYDASARGVVKRLRINSIRKLGKYGLQCTESVLIVPRTLIDKMKKTIEEIRFTYRDAKEHLLKNYEEELEPEIYVIPLIGEQTEALKTIAVKRLVDKLEKIIQRLLRLTVEIEELEEDEKKKVRYNVKRVLRELEHTQDIIEELGIESVKLKEKFRLAEEVIREVLEEVMSERE